MKSWHKLILGMWAMLMAASLVWAGTFTSYNDITGLASTDELLIYDASEGSGDGLANITVANAFGKLFYGSDITGNSSLNTTQLQGYFYVVTAACTVTLDAAADVGFGSVSMFYIRDAAETVIIEIDNSDIINLHGTPLDAGDTIDSPGNAGDFICLIATTDADGGGTDGWITLGYGEEDWTDGDAT